jgi:hypothetical protein
MTDDEIRADRLQTQIAQVLYEAQGGFGVMPNDSWRNVADRVLAIPEIETALRVSDLMKSGGDFTSALATGLARSSSNEKERGT